VGLIISQHLLWHFGNIHRNPTPGLYQWRNHPCLLRRSGPWFYAGINPILTAIVFAILSAFGVQWMSHKQSIREDSAIAVVWALGMATGIIFIFMSPGFTPSLTEYLFGNILTITHTDLIYFGLFSVLLIIFSYLFQRQIVYVAFDREFAQVRHLPVQFIESCMLILIAVCIVLTIRMIGIVLLMSVLTLPQMIAGIYYNDYRKIMYGSVVFCLIACIGGLFASYWLNVPTGACIVFLLTLIYSILRLTHSFQSKSEQKKQ
jgi:ABC-type Mn2+/Zn2+ transport systems, permease components